MTKIKQLITHLDRFYTKYINTVTLVLILIPAIRMIYDFYTGDLLHALACFLTVSVVIGINILLELMEINQRGGR